MFYSFADGPEGGRYYDCHPIENMDHEQTILAYEMNGEPLNESHGAPFRLRDEVELGFKQVKWVQAIELVDRRAPGRGAGRLQRGPGVLRVSDAHLTREHGLRADGQQVPGNNPAELS